MSEETGQVSEEFFECFRTGMGSLRDTCNCGREHWDAYNSYDWEVGEKEGLTLTSEQTPDKCIAHDGSFTSYEINGLHFIMDCPCGGAWKYEQFIRRQAPEIAAYLNKIAAQLLAEAAAHQVSPSVTIPRDPAKALLQEVLAAHNAKETTLPPATLERISALFVTERINA